jgi:hypothetical protein
MKKEVPNIEWPIDTTRFVGFVDVMGFKDMVARKTHEEVGEVLNAMVFMKDILSRLIVAEGAISNGKVDKGRVKSISFSDSVLFITRDDSIESLSVLCGIMQIFHEAALQRTAPTKGAISMGRFTADFDNSLFYGQPLIDAYELQDFVHYYGIVADNKIDEYLLKQHRAGKIETEEINRYFFRIPTPMKSGKVIHHNLRISNMTKPQLDDLYSMISGPVRKYVDNTVEIYKEMNPNFK